MFCTKCGNKLSAGAAFCSACGTARRQEGLAPPAAANRPAARPRPLKDRMGDWLILPVAILLIFTGIASMGLAVIGKTTVAQVTDYQQVLLLNNDESTRDPNRYKLDYTFVAGGELYTGSVTRVFSGGSHMRQTLSVRYLPFWPHVNAEDNKMTGLAGPVMTGIGTLLFVLGVKKIFQTRKKNR